MLTVKAIGLKEILVALESAERTFELDKGGLGTSLLVAAARGITQAMDDEEDPDGFPWLPLSATYEAWKLNIAPQAPMGVLYGIMKTPENIQGVCYIGVEYCEMRFGLDPLSRIEAEKFTYGGIITGTNQPPRPFYALTTSAANEATKILETVFQTAW